MFIVLAPLVTTFSSVASKGGRPPSALVSPALAAALSSTLTDSSPLLTASPTALSLLQQKPLTPPQLPAVSEFAAADRDCVEQQQQYNPQEFVLSALVATQQSLSQLQQVEEGGASQPRLTVSQLLSNTFDSYISA